MIRIFSILLVLFATVQINASLGIVKDIRRYKLSKKISKDDYSKVNKIVSSRDFDNKYSIDTLLASGESFLTKAILEGKTNSALIFINNSKLINTTNRDNKTPLLLALEKQDADLIKLLIQGGADIVSNFGAEVSFLEIISKDVFSFKEIVCEIIKDLGKRDIEYQDTVIGIIFEKAEDNELGAKKLLTNALLKAKNIAYIELALGRGSLDYNKPYFYIKEQGKGKGLEVSLLEYAIISDRESILKFVLPHCVFFLKQEENRVSFLKKAISYQATNALNMMYKQGISFEAEGGTEESLLFFACKNKLFKSIEAIIDLGVSVEQSKDETQDVFSMLIQSASLKTIKKVLVKHSLDLNHKYVFIDPRAKEKAELMTPVDYLLLSKKHSAVKVLLDTERVEWESVEDYIKTLQYLLEAKNKYLFNRVWEVENTLSDIDIAKLAVFAVENSSWDCLESIVLSIDINSFPQESVDKITIEAIIANKIEIAKLLLKKGVIKDKIISYITAALSKKLNRMVKIIWEEYEKNHIGEKLSVDEFMILMCKHGNKEVVEYALRKGANPSGVDTKGNLPLSMAIEFNHYDIVKLLLDRGSKINIFCCSIKRMIFSARQNKNFDILSLLIHRLDSKLPDYSKTECGQILNYFIKNKLKLKAIEVLRTKSVDLDVVDEVGNTPLMNAIVIKDYDIIKRLFYLGSKVNCYNKKRESPAKMLIGNSAIKGYINFLASLESGKYKEEVGNFLAQKGAIEKFLCLKKINKKEKSYLINYLARHIVESICSFQEWLSYQSLFKIEGIDLDGCVTEIWKSKGNELVVLDHEDKFLPAMVTKKVKTNKAKEKDCSICLSMCVDQKCTGIGPASCSCFVCDECSDRLIDYVVHKNGAEENLCPGCSQEVSASYLSLCGRSKDEIVKYDTNRIKRKLSRIKEWYFCPTADCLDGRKAFEGESGFFSCRLCDYEGCLKCGKNHERGQCAQYESQCKEIKTMLLEGRKKPPNKHPNKVTSANYLKGRFRPCYFCGVITEKELDGTSNNGQCNSMRCKNPKCLKSWHWNHGSHLKHPNNIYRSHNFTSHDFDRKAQQYSPLVKPRL
jgi:ankyrin repeat protein